MKMTGRNNWVCQKGGDEGTAGGRGGVFIPGWMPALIVE